MLSKRFFKTKDEVEVTFETDSHNGTPGVSLLCEANGWEPIPMKKTRDGTWRVKVRLPLERRLEFRYRTADGAWANDDSADGYIPNEYGTDNSLVDTHRP